MRLRVSFALLEISLIGAVAFAILSNCKQALMVLCRLAASLFVENSADGGSDSDTGHGLSLPTVAMRAVPALGFEPTPLSPSPTNVAPYRAFAKIPPARGR